MPYVVTDTREIETMTPTGTARKLYRVYLQTANGATGSVDITPADWNKVRVAEILMAKAEELDLAFAIASV